MSAMVRATIVIALLWPTTPAATHAHDRADHASWGDPGPSTVLTVAGRVPLPSIEVVLDPPEPDGDDGWYVTPVTFMLSSDDPDATFEWYLEGAGGYWVPWTGPVTLVPDRRYEISARASGEGGISETVTVTFDLDATAPVTSAVLDGPMDGDVYVGDVTVTLEVFELWSGVAATQIRKVGEPGRPYEAPVTVKDDGVHTIEFGSVDAAGNVEDRRQVVFEIARPPLPDPPDPDPPAPDPPVGGEETMCERRPGSASFVDAPGSGHRLFIDCLARLGIVEGMGDGLFHPTRDVSRGQLASFVARALRLVTSEVPPVSGAPFLDVEPGSTHARAIAELHGAGIIRGYPDGTFRPAQPVSREQTARYVVNALEAVVPGPLPTSGERFTDVTSDRYVVDIDKLVTAGIVRGFGDGTFGPHRRVTRGQTARLVGNALEEAERQGVLGLARD